jgi:hypothetical protein
LGDGAGDALGDGARDGGALDAATAAALASRRSRLQQLGILARLFMAFLG